MDTTETYLLDKPTQKLQNPLQRILPQLPLRTQQAEHIHKVIIHGIILGRQLGKEHARQIRNLLVVVLQTLGHLAQLALDLDLAGEDQEGQRHQAGPLDGAVAVVEPAVQEIGVFVDQMVEADGHVSEGDDGVGAHDGVGGAFEDGDQEGEVPFAVLG